MFVGAHTSRAAPSRPNSSDNFRSLEEGSEGCKSCSPDPGSLTGGGSKTLLIFQLLLMSLSLSHRKPHANPLLPLLRQHQDCRIPPSAARLGSPWHLRHDRSAQLMLSIKAERVPQVGDL